MYTMRFDLRPLRLTTGWSEPNVSRTLSVIYKFALSCLYPTQEHQVFERQARLSCEVALQN